MAGLLLYIALGFTSCANDDNQVEPMPTQPDVEQTVEQWLKAMPGVSGVTEQQGTSFKGVPGPYYYFYFDQLIDHKHPEKGTFRQKGVLRYVGQDAPTVLHTQGYETGDTVPSLVVPSLVPILNANLIELEYRYFGDSQPQPLDNIDFTYLDSEQASDDLHALVTAFKATGRFPKQWISMGVSKNGYATAMYAYYSSKKGYNDIDLYVPVAAPFNVTLDDPRPGAYMIQNSTAFDPESDKKLKGLGRAICRDTPLSKYLIETHRRQYPKWVSDTRKDGYSEEQIDMYVITHYAVMYQSNLLSKLSYNPISSWTDLIPDTTGQTQLDYAEKFIAMDDKDLREYIKKRKQANTRIGPTEEEMLKKRKTDGMFSYEVQVAKEIGSIEYKFDYLKGCPYYSPDFVELILKTAYRTDAVLPRFTALYSNAQALDFLNNFLPTTTQKMVFVYGEQDPWTGSAIPDPTNPNVKKIIVPRGCHNDYFNEPDKCPVETYNEIMRAVREVIK